MRAKLSLLVLLALTLGMAFFSSTGIPEDASASIRAGAGFASVGGSLAPLGRVAVDLLPLGILTLSADAEYWFFSLSSQQLLPFLAASMSVSLPWVVQATVGIAPIVSISPQVGVVPRTLMAKAGLEVPVGPIEIFGEALFLVSSLEAYSEGTFFAFGVTFEF